jgi:hypothetical protein
MKLETLVMNELAPDVDDKVCYTTPDLLAGSESRAGGKLYRVNALAWSWGE